MCLLASTVSYLIRMDVAEVSVSSCFQSDRVLVEVGNGWKMLRRIVIQGNGVFECFTRYH